MKHFFNCIKGEATTSNAGQRREKVYDDEPSDPNAPLFPIDPPLPAKCGKPYQWHDILVGTVNFQQSLYLGRGNFGKVYRCHIYKTKEVAAVKIQEKPDQTYHNEFLAEVTTLHEANHPNVIKLLGRCYGLKKRAIIYEFMANGSLERHISVNERQVQGPQGPQQPIKVLDWERRMKIAVGVAQGLLYLHQKLKVINLDVKAGNILLDANFVPKLTDFGLATKIIVNKTGEEQEQPVSPAKGTPGWIAPETENYALVSTKSDVYSYGVFLFVLFTGRKAYDMQKSSKLTDWVMQLWTSSKYEPVDAALGNSYSVEGLTKIYETARMCINLQPHARPAMSEVETKVREAATFPILELEKNRLSL